MNEYLCHGMGVNSTALMLLLNEDGVEYESVFVDHGGDYPKTYEYVDYLQDNGYPITVLKPKVEGYDNLIDYCIAKNLRPSRMRRWCTDKFKKRVLNKYIDIPAIKYIGIDSGENRELFVSDKKGVENRFPLVERGLDRDGCVKIIEDAGLRVPSKSCCWICFNANKKEKRKLKINYPELYEMRKKIEESADKEYAKLNYKVLTNYMEDLKNE